MSMFNLAQCRLWLGIIMTKHGTEVKSCYQLETKNQYVSMGFCSASCANWNAPFPLKRLRSASLFVDHDSLRSFIVPLDLNDSPCCMWLPLCHPKICGDTSLAGKIRSLRSSLRCTAWQWLETYIISYNFFGCISGFRVFRGRLQENTATTSQVVETNWNKVRRPARAVCWSTGYEEFLCSQPGVPRTILRRVLAEEFWGLSKIPGARDGCL